LTRQEHLVSPAELLLAAPDAEVVKVGERSSVKGASHRFIHHTAAEASPCTVSPPPNSVASGEAEASPCTMEPTLSKLESEEEARPCTMEPSEKEASPCAVEPPPLDFSREEEKEQQLEAFNKIALAGTGDDEEKSCQFQLEDFYNKTIRRKTDDNDENCGNSDWE